MVYKNYYCPGKIEMIKVLRRRILPVLRIAATYIMSVKDWRQPCRLHTPTVKTPCNTACDPSGFFMCFGSLHLGG